MRQRGSEAVSSEEREGRAVSEGKGRGGKRGDERMGQRGGESGRVTQSLAAWPAPARAHRGRIWRIWAFRAGSRRRGAH